MRTRSRFFDEQFFARLGVVVFVFVSGTASAGDPGDIGSTLAPPTSTLPQESVELVRLLYPGWDPETLRVEPGSTTAARLLATQPWKSGFSVALVEKGFSDSPGELTTSQAGRNSCTLLLARPKAGGFVRVATTEIADGCTGLLADEWPKDGTTRLLGVTDEWMNHGFGTTRIKLYEQRGSALARVFEETVATAEDGKSHVCVLAVVPNKPVNDLNLTCPGTLRTFRWNGQSFAASDAANVVLTGEWVDRAQAVLRVQLGKVDQQQVMATSIMGVLHPSGAAPSLEEIEVSAMGSTLVATFTVDWKGGIVGTPYRTVVRWKCTQSQNLGIQLISDNGPKVAAANLEQLSNWFQTEFYPVLLANTK